MDTPASRATSLSVAGCGREGPAACAMGVLLSRGACRGGGHVARKTVREWFRSKAPDASSRISVRSSTPGQDRGIDGRWGGF
ncbi:hypothetical protein GCM10027168_39780 [Streptomyces capparidis]